MKLIAAGRRDKEIAVALAISTQTARVHVKNIFAKLEVGDRTEAMNVAIRRGIIHIDRARRERPCPRVARHQCSGRLILLGVYFGLEEAESAECSRRDHGGAELHGAQVPNRQDASQEHERRVAAQCAAWIGTCGRSQAPWDSWGVCDLPHVPIHGAGRRPAPPAASASLCPLLISA